LATNRNGGMLRLNASRHDDDDDDDDKFSTTPVLDLPIPKGWKAELT